MKRLTLLLFLLVAMPAYGQANKIVPIAPPAPVKWDEITIPKGQKLARLTSGDTPGKWLLIDSDAEMVVQDGGKVAIVTGSPGKKYRIVVSCNDSDPYCLLLTFADGGNPGPIIPDPIVPPPVIPVDPFKQKLKGLYAADTSADKAKVLMDLTNLFASAQSMAVDESITDIETLSKQITGAAKTLAPNVLSELRKALVAEMQLAFPVNYALTKDVRDKAKALFIKITIALSEVNK